jgi:hypothetical protein
VKKFTPLYAPYPRLENVNSWGIRELFWEGFVRTPVGDHLRDQRSAFARQANAHNASKT